MAMRGRPCGRRRLTRPAKLRKRIISPPRHGGKASVWRNRSAIPRAPGHCSVSATWVRSAKRRHAGAFRTGHGSSTERRIVIHCCSLLFARAGTPGKAHKAVRRKAKFAARSNARIVISLLLTMPRCGGAAHDTKRHRTTSTHGAGARCRSGQDAGPASSPGSVLSSSRCQTARSARWRQCVFVPRAASLRAPRGTVGPTDRLRKTTSNANLSSTITLRSQ